MGPSVVNSVHSVKDIGNAGVCVCRDRATEELPVPSF